MEEQNINTVFFLGPNGSYTQIAKEKFARYFGFEKAHSIGLKNITSVLDNFILNENSIAIVPVENAIEGFVRETLDGIKAFEDPQLTIFAATQIPIKHCLVGNSKAAGAIKTIVSHPQALAQCRNTITSLIPHEVEQLPYSSTSGAAIYIKDKGETYAAITNYETAKLYGLEIIKENINDEKGNVTRFLMLKRGTTFPTRHDKTSIVFATKNEHGALFKVLKVFEKHKINLTHISSRPSKKNLGEYNFFVDFTGHISEKNIVKTLKDVEKCSTWLKVLGSFAEI